MTSSPIPRRPLTAGSEIDAWCTRCKMDLGHRIVAMVSGAPKRVVCMTCNSEHNYRAPKAASPALPRAPRRAATATASNGAPAAEKKARIPATRAEWERQVRSGRPLRRYTTAERFSVGDLVQHKKFGDGFVSAVIGDGKVTITFADGERTLIHAAG